MAQVSSSIGMLTSHVQGLGFRSCEEIVLLGNKQVSNQASKQASKQNDTMGTSCEEYASIKTCKVEIGFRD